MAIDATRLRTRRALLVAAGSAAAATVATALGRPITAYAGTDGDVVLDATNTATGTTKLVNTTHDQAVLMGQSTNGTGVHGRSTWQYGVRGQSTYDAGVYATSATGIAVEALLTGAGPAAVSAHAVNPGTAAIAATADNGIGVDITVGNGHGLQIIASSAGISCEGGDIGIVAWSHPDGGTGIHGTGHNDGAGVAGHSEGDEPGAGGSGAGVYGFSGSGPGVSGESETGPAILGYSGGGGVPGTPMKVGVFGYADLDATARGVVGQSPPGWGVSGIATTGRGVSGQATSGRGVMGYATNGTAVLAQSADPMAGLGFRAIGRVKLDQCAGVAAIAAGASSVTVTPGIDLITSSAVVATLQGNAGAATTTVSRVFVNATTDKFTIYLTATATQSVRVAWHVFG